MKALTFWLVRGALFVAVLFALWALGWRNWSVFVGAAAITWFVSYALFGSLYDPASEWLEDLFSRRAPKS